MVPNVVMQSIKVTELKSHLSRYLRQASRGERITVRDRDNPIAELGPARGEPLSWRDRLVREGRLRPGTQDWTRTVNLDHRAARGYSVVASRRQPARDPDRSTSTLTKDSVANGVASVLGRGPRNHGLGRHASWQSCIDHCPFDHWSSGRTTSVRPTAAISRGLTVHGVGADAHD